MKRERERERERERDKKLNSEEMEVKTRRGRGVVSLKENDESFHARCNRKSDLNVRESSLCEIR